MKRSILVKNFAVCFAKRWRRFITELAIPSDGSWPPYCLADDVLYIGCYDSRSADIPSDAQSVLLYLNGVFSPKTVNTIEENIRHFSSIVEDSDKIVNDFISKQSNRYWTKLVIDSTVRRVFDIDPKNLFSTRSYSNNPQKADEKNGTEIPSCSDTDSEDTLNIVQITLSGPSLQTALLNHPILRGILRTAASFHPFLNGDHPSYHGLNPHGLDQMDKEAMVRGHLATHHGSRNETSPRRNISTSFNFAQSFMIWAVFAAKFTDLDAVETGQDILGREFNISGGQYNGIIVIKFATTQPAPAGLTSHTFHGRYDAVPWSTLCMEQFYANYLLDVFWRKYKPATSILKVFPDVIHAPELPATMAALGTWVKPSLIRSPGWRSSWNTPAAEASLRSNYIRAYAISFSQTAIVEGGQVRTKKAHKFTSFARRLFSF